MIATRWSAMMRSKIRAAGRDNRGGSRSSNGAQRGNRNGGGPSRFDGAPLPDEPRGGYGGRGGAPDDDIPF